MMRKTLLGFLVLVVCVSSLVVPADLSDASIAPLEGFFTFESNSKAVVSAAGELPGEGYYFALFGGPDDEFGEQAVKQCPRLLREAFGLYPRKKDSLFHFRFVEMACKINAELRALSKDSAFNSAGVTSVQGVSMSLLVMYPGIAKFFSIGERLGFLHDSGSRRPSSIIDFKHRSGYLLGVLDKGIEMFRDSRGFLSVWDGRELPLFKSEDCIVLATVPGEERGDGRMTVSVGRLARRQHDKYALRHGKSSSIVGDASACFGARSLHAIAVPGAEAAGDSEQGMVLAEKTSALPGLTIAQCRLKFSLDTAPFGEELKKLVAECYEIHPAGFNVCVDLPGINSQSGRDCRIIVLVDHREKECFAQLLVEEHPYPYAPVTAFSARRVPSVTLLSDLADGLSTFRLLPLKGSGAGSAGDVAELFVEKGCEINSAIFAKMSRIDPWGLSGATAPIFPPQDLALHLRPQRDCAFELRDDLNEWQSALAAFVREKVVDRIKLKALQRALALKFHSDHHSQDPEFGNQVFRLFHDPLREIFEYAGPDLMVSYWDVMVALNFTKPVLGSRALVDQRRVKEELLRHDTIESFRRGVGCLLYSKKAGSVLDHGAVGTAVLAEPTHSQVQMVINRSGTESIFAMCGSSGQGADATLACFYARQLQNFSPLVASLSCEEIASRLSAMRARVLSLSPLCFDSNIREPIGVAAFFYHENSLAYALMDRPDGIIFIDEQGMVLDLTPQRFLSFNAAGSEKASQKVLSTFGDGVFVGRFPLPHKVRFVAIASEGTLERISAADLGSEIKKLSDSGMTPLEVSQYLVVQAHLDSSSQRKAWSSKFHHTLSSEEQAATPEGSYFSRLHDPGLLVIDMAPLRAEHGHLPKAASGNGASLSAGPVVPATGDEFEDCSSSAVGLLQDQGKRDYMEDVLVHKTLDSGITFLGVLDGHSPSNKFSGQGLAVAQACAHMFDSLVDLDEAKIRSCCHMMEQRLKNGLVSRDVYNWCGTTLSCVLVKGSLLCVVNLGDSKTVVTSPEGGVAFESKNHEATNAFEQVRINNAGGTVDDQGYLNGKLACSRSFGDGDVGAGLGKEVDITWFDYSSEKYRFVVVASDGLWDLVTPEYVASEIANSSAAGKSLKQILDELHAEVSGCKDDNISVGVMDLHRLCGTVREQGKHKGEVIGCAAGSAGEIEDKSVDESAWTPFSYEGIMRNADDVIWERTVDLHGPDMQEQEAAFLLYHGSIEGRLRSAVGLFLAKGPNPYRSMQDTAAIKRLANGVDFFGVFDGHGSAGFELASESAREFPKYLGRLDALDWAGIGARIVKACEDFDAYLRRVFSADSFYESSGTTFTGILRHGDELVIANAGDSRTIVIDEGGMVVLESEDHTPTNPQEAERIKASGGTISAGGRVNGILNVSRGFGDGDSGEAISKVPDVFTCTYEPRRHRFAILASDGLWGVMSSKVVASRVRYWISKGESLDEVARLLGTEVLGLEKHPDNISIVIIDLHALMSAPMHEAAVEQQPLGVPEAAMSTNQVPVVTEVVGYEGLIPVLESTDPLYDLQPKTKLFNELLSDTMSRVEDYFGLAKNEAPGQLITLGQALYRKNHAVFTVIAVVKVAGKEYFLFLDLYENLGACYASDDKGFVSFQAFKAACEAAPEEAITLCWAINYKPSICRLLGL